MHPSRLPRRPSRDGSARTLPAPRGVGLGLLWEPLADARLGLRGQSLMGPAVRPVALGASPADPVAAAQPLAPGAHPGPSPLRRDGDTDSVSTMVVHDVEDLAGGGSGGSESSYGGEGTLLVQRVSGRALFPLLSAHRGWPFWEGQSQSSPFHCSVAGGGEHCLPASAGFAWRQRLAGAPTSQPPPPARSTAQACPPALPWGRDRLAGFLRGAQCCCGSFCSAPLFAGLLAGPFCVCSLPKGGPLVRPPGVG